MLNSPLPPLSSFCLPLTPTSNASRGSHHQRYPNPPSPWPPARPPGPRDCPPPHSSRPRLVASFLLKCRSTTPPPAASLHLKQDQSPSPATHSYATWASVLRSLTSFLLQLQSLPSVPDTPMPSINVYPLNMPSIFPPPGPLLLVPQSKIFCPVICTPGPSCRPELSWSFHVTLSLSDIHPL